jgi:hypothetical protein
MESPERDEQETVEDLEPREDDEDAVRGGSKKHSGLDEEEPPVQT